MSPEIYPEQRLEQFRNVHPGVSGLVCGCGPSMCEFRPPSGGITFSIADSGRDFLPDYTFIQDDLRSYRGERLANIQNTRAKYCFSPVSNLVLLNVSVVRIRASQYGGVDWNTPGELPYTGTSAYMAICLSVLMGCNPIGLIGIDYTGDHFFSKNERCQTRYNLNKLDEEFRILSIALRERAIQVWNLSTISKLATFDKCSLSDFIRAMPTKIAT